MRTQRTLVVAAAVAAIVVAANASEGAYFSQSWGWVALAFLVPTTVLVILDRVSAPGRLRIAFASLVGALGVWIALSTIWSISPSGSAREVERILVYVSVALAVTLVLRRGDGASIAAGTLLGVTVVAGYGLAMKLYPDAFDVSYDMFNTYRLAEPLGYGNAFGMMTVLGIILAAGFVTHARRTWAAAASGATVPLLVVALYLSFSRGSWFALFFGLGVTIAIDPRRTTLVLSILALAPASAAGVVVASRQDALTTVDVAVADQAREGHRLAWVVVGLIVVSAISAWISHRIARAVPTTSRMRRGVAVALASCAFAAASIVLMQFGGPISAASEFRERFEAPADPVSSLNDRLFSLSGNGRAETLGVGWDLAASHPIAGTGAGTFEILWYEERPTTRIVRDAHSLYVEMFSELGMVGLVLVMAALAMPAVAAIRCRRSRFVPPACGAYLAWLAASGLDWHWEMVGLTTTSLLLGSVGLVSAERRVPRRLRDGSRLALVGVTGTLSVLAVWTLVGNQALFAGREAIARNDWSEARDHAVRAQSLLPWSHEPDFVRGDAAAGLGDREGALRAYRDAVATDPRNWVAWLRLAKVARGAERHAAYDRVHKLNPLERGVTGRVTFRAPG